MVYAAEPTALVEKPDAVAMALMVMLEATEIAPLYFVEDVVGGEPSVV
jgi:hypothetical protein